MIKVMHGLNKSDCAYVILGVLSADGRHHENCRKKFTNMQNIRASHSKTLHAISENESYLLLSNLFASNPSRVWTSLDLYDEYVHLGGISLSRKELIPKLLAESISNKYR